MSDPNEQHLRYWSPANVKLFAMVGGVPLWIDDGLGVDLRIQDQKTPHFGFRDRYFRAVSHDRTIVSGNLYINFRYPNYLSHAVRSGRGAVIPTSSSGLNPFVNPPTRNLLGALDTQDTIDKLRDTMISGVEAFDEYSRDFKKVFYEGGFKEVGPLQEFDELRPSEVQTEFGNSLNILVRYGDETNPGEQRFAQVIQDVYFVGTAQQASMLDGNGDRSIIEVYSFFAKNVKYQEQV